jgi:CMP-N-acetylneuraminic acid synthetase
LNYNILGIIPARGGSKGIPDKNIHPLKGKPLISYSIEQGLNSQLLTDLIISTDSIKIKEVSEKYGAKVPFLRPSELSSDSALAIPTIKHAVEAYEKIVGYKYDYIVMLQPTAPLRLAIDIDNSLKMLINTDADGVISVVDVDNYHPAKMKIIEGNYLYDYVKTNQENPPRQKLPKVYIVNGAIYATKRDIFINNNTFKGEECLHYEMPDERSVNIDKKTDFIVAEYLLNNN